MWKYIIYGALMAYIAYWLISVIRKRMTGEVYEACGMGFYISLIFWGGSKPGFGILPLRIIGFLVFIPAAFFVASSFITLKLKGKPTTGWEPTTMIINAGVYRITRHPLYLGAAIWSVALILVFQSIPSVIMASVAIFCFWMASQKEEEFNLGKFGDEYRRYMADVPRWNFLKGIKNLKI